MQRDITSFLRQFIAFRTVAGANEEKKKCLEWVYEAFLACPPKSAEGGRRWERAAVWAVERRAVRGEVDSAPYLYLPHPHPKLLWFAHIDVVPAEDHQFDLKIEGDRLIGRGTADMKGNQLPFLMAYSDALAEGIDPPISILLTSDEETAGLTIPTLLESGIINSIPVAFTPDCGPKIVCEHKGVIWADLTCTGKGCHAAYPWAGENPIFLLMEVLAIIKKEYPPEDKEAWRMTVTPTDIEGSHARNQVPESASCKLDIRYTPDDSLSPEAVILKLHNILPAHCTLSIHRAASPLHTDQKHPTVQLIQRIAEEIIGKPVPIEREPGGTDARYFGEKGIPAFLFGAEGGEIHGKKEWVSHSYLMKHYEICKELISTLCRTK